MVPVVEAVEQSVMVALDAGNSVTAVAEAWTISGATPNRGAIYEIKRKYDAPEDSDDVLLPFQWVSRTVETATGTRKVYDVIADLQEFGPEEFTGTVTWRYDRITDTLDQVLTEYDPYPESSLYYKTVLARWLKAHPYPEETHE